MSLPAQIWMLLAYNCAPSWNQSIQRPRARRPARGVRVTLHVTSNQSTPLPGAQITANAIAYYGYSTATTDLDGNAQMYLRGGGYTIYVAPAVEGMVSWSFPVMIQGEVT
jgi:hypothetical protein